MVSLSSLVTLSFRKISYAWKSTFWVSLLLPRRYLPNYRLTLDNRLYFSRTDHIFSLSLTAGRCSRKFRISAKQHWPQRGLLRSLSKWRRSSLLRVLSKGKTCVGVPRTDWLIVIHYPVSAWSSLHSSPHWIPFLVGFPSELPYSISDSDA